MSRFYRCIAVLAFFLPFVAFAQNTVTVSGRIKDSSGATVSGGSAVNGYKACFTLLDGNAQTPPNPRIVGGSGTIIVAKNFCVTPDASGVYSTAVVANDRILNADGTTGGTQWSVAYTKGGQYITGSTYTFLIADVSENLDTKVANSVSPVVPAPTGDTTYARLLGDNMPFLGPIQSPGGTFTGLLSGTTAVFSGSVALSTATATTFNGIRYAAAGTLQADINAACSGTVPGVVVLPEGTVTIAAGLSIPNKCRVVGYGRDATIIATSGTAAFDVFTNTDQTTGNAISVHDLQINSTSFSSGVGRDIYFKNLTGYRIDNVKMLNARTFCVLIDQGSGQGWITNNWCDGVTIGSGFLIGNGPVNGAATDLTVMGNYTANSITANGIFIAGSGTAGTTGSCRGSIANNRSFHNADTQIEVGDSSCDIALSNNQVEMQSVGSTGILIRSAQNVAASGNVIKALSFTIVSASVTANVATVVVAASPAHPFSSGQSVTFAGMTGAVSGLNGTFTLTAGTTATTLTYALVTANIGSTSTSGTATGTGQIGIYAWNNGGDNVPFKDLGITGNTVSGLIGATSSDIAWSSASASSGPLNVTGNTTDPADTKRYDPKTTNIVALTVNGDDGTLIQTEGAAPTAQAGKDYLYADSASHRWKVNMNNAGAVQLVVSGADISTTDTIAKIQGVTVSGTTGTGNVMFHTAPTFSTSLTFTATAIWGTSQVRLGANQAFSFASANDGSVTSADSFMNRQAAGVVGFGTTLTTTDAAVKAKLYQTDTNCANSGGTCASASAGRVSVAAAATTVTVATTAVTANSEIILTRDDTLGTALSVTCNTATALGDLKVSTRTAGTSFVITVQNAPATNPYCISYRITN